MMHSRSKWFGLLFLTVAAAFAGCSSTNNSVASQYIDDLAWLPNESGLLATIDQLTVSAIDGSEYDAINLFQIGADGSVGNSINPSPAAPNGSGYTPLVFISPDGRTAIEQYSTSIYSVDLSSGNTTNIIQNTNLLGVSPDMKYVLTTSVGEQSTAKVLALYNISTSPPTLIQTKPTVVGVISTKAIWIDDAHFALAKSDSTGANNTPYFHVDIYDTNGNVTQTIPDASISLNTGAYAPKSGDLFFLNHALGIDKFNLATKARTSIISNDSVESFDVSSDGKLLVYSSQEFSQNLQGYAVNVADGHKTSLASDMTAPRLSPNADKVAFIHQISGGENSDIQVIGVSLPN